jgi:hypothetical protein
MLAGRAIYIWKLKNVVGAGSVDDVVARAIRSKITSLWVKIGDGDSPFENTKGAVGKLLTQLVLKCKQSGISVLGFHVPICATEQSVSDEVGFVENAVRDFGLAGVVVDNEDGRGFFRGDARIAALYASGLRTAMTRANKLVVMSSNDIVSSHPKSYATIIGKAIDVNAPQVYYGQSRSVSARLNEAEKENKPIAAPFFPVGAAFLRNPKDNDGGFLDPKQCAEWAKDFIDLVSLLHRMSPSQFPGYGFWNWDEAPDEFWQALAETEVFSQPVAAPLDRPFLPAAEALFVRAPDASAPALQVSPSEIPSDDCLVYEQATGRTLVKQSGQYDTIGVGYSGSLSKGGKNDPRKQCEQDIGPIPRGLYRIGPPGPGPSPYSLRLTPDPSNDMCGRSNFLIHGDSISHPGNASEVCIILSRSEREAIVKTGLKLLVVTDAVASQSVIGAQAASPPAPYTPPALQDIKDQKPLCSVGPRKVRPLDQAVAADPSRASAILETQSKWVNGTVLHYCFFTDGQYAIAADQAGAVRRAFAKWKAVGIGLNFKEVAELSEAEVRIGYIQGISQSAVGRDVLNVPLTEPTTSYGWNLNTQYGSGTALHELGHVLGMEHEHQSPFAGITWNDEAVYASLGGPPNNWDRQKTYFNILKKLDPDFVQGSSWDPDSIMEYEFAPGLIVEPKQYANGLTPPGTLSAADKEWVLNWYRPMEAAPAPLEPLHSVVVKLAAGEQADFDIKPSESRKYTFETKGATDALLVLFEEVDGAPRYLSGDDDSGEPRSASITYKLFAGRSYILRLRLVYPGPTGETAVIYF